MTCVLLMTAIAHKYFVIECALIVGILCIKYFNGFNILMLGKNNHYDMAELKSV